MLKVSGNEEYPLVNTPAEITTHAILRFVELITSQSRAVILREAKHRIILL